MKPTAYFWKEGKVVEFDAYPCVDNIRKAKLEGMYCVDLNETLPAQRYGIFDPIQCWLSVPFEEMPKEFLAALLLMGVSI